MAIPTLATHPPNKTCNFASWLAPDRTNPTAKLHHTTFNILNIFPSKQLPLWKNKTY